MLYPHTHTYKFLLFIDGTCDRAKSPENLFGIYVINYNINEIKNAEINLTLQPGSELLLFVIRFFYKIR